MPPRGAEQPALAVRNGARPIDIGAQRLSQRVVLAAFLMQADRPPGAARPQILDLHLQGRGDPRIRVGQCRDRRGIAQDHTYIVFLLQASNAINLAQDAKPVF